MKHIKLFEDYTTPKKTIVMLGLPGSGKTYLSKKIQRENPEMNYVIYDDFYWNRAKNNFGKENQIISDGMLMTMSPKIIEDIKNSVKSSGAELEMIYFENNPDKAFANVEMRKSNDTAEGHQRHISKRDIDMMSAGYEIPTGAKIVPIWVGN